MKFTLSWLKDFLETNASLEEISDTLTAIGLEVESVTNPGDDLRPFIVAEIIAAEKHPNADKLKVCQVNSGDKTLSIVCGAPNARAGIKVTLAREGSIIPTNGMKIKKSKIRDVESNGMLCSARELGLGEDHDGIIELPDDAKIGDSIVDTLGLDDPMVEIAITPNRADCLGVYGIARDLAATGLGILKPITTPNISGNGASAVSVSINTSKCAQFIGCTISGVKNGLSPEWMQQRLTATGLRPISALVDITNYITYSYGRPLHVYDVAKLKGNIEVRPAKAGEKFLALNEKEYTLEDGMTTIADDSGVLGLGGIIGGESTGCDENTTDIFLECALFDPVDIATTGRKLQIDSDARYRFERGVDVAFVEDGTKIGTQMIIELCGGTPSEFMTAGETPQWKRDIPLSPEHINKLGGTDIEKSNIQTILESLGFEIANDGVIPPSWRGDVEGKADLAEEVLRIYGYENIPAVPIEKSQHVTSSRLTPMQKRTSITRRALAGRGMHECCSWSFLPEGYAKAFGGGQDALKLVNPISSELNSMRPSLLPNLLAAAQNNANRGYTNLALFEVGAQFFGIEPEGQQQVAAGIRTGDMASKNPHGTQRAIDAFDAKADAFVVLESCGFKTDNLQINRDDLPTWYHPGQAGVLKIGKTTLGYFGTIHPSTLKSVDVEFGAVGFEIFLENIPMPKQKATKAKPTLTLSDFQSVERDFAFITDMSIAAADLLGAVRKADKALIKDANIFDVYAGKGVEEGKQSIALSVTLQALDRTLTEDDIEATSNKIIENTAKLGAYLRK